MRDVYKIYLDDYLHLMAKHDNDLVEAITEFIKATHS